MVGCGDFSEDRPSIPGDDGGVYAYDGAGSPDGGTVMAVPERSGSYYAGDENDAAETEDYASTGAAPDPSRAGLASCFDTLDGTDDRDSVSRNGLIDCADPGCMTLGACRVGNARLCDTPVSTVLDTTGCTGVVTGTCLGAQYEVFGSPAPWVTSPDLDLHPGGNAYDSGVVFASPIDLRTVQARLTASFASPMCAVGETCVESAAVGFTEQSDFGTTMRVAPIAALVYSGARETVSLVLGSTVAASWPFDSANPTWDLVLYPDGTLAVENASAVVTTDAPRFTPVAAARALVYGRNQNRAFPSINGARITSLTLRRAHCDMPEAWTDRTAATVLAPMGGVDHPLVDPGGLSAARDGAGRLWIAFHDTADAEQMRLFAAAERDGIPGSFIVTRSDGVLSGADVRDPDIYWDEGGATWHVLYTGVNGASKAIFHVETTSLVDPLPAGMPVLEASVFGVRAIESATYTMTGSGVPVIVARVEGDAGHRLEVFVGDTPDGPYYRLTDATLPGLTLRGVPRTEASFDTDEIAAPSIEIVGSAFHLYYAGRDGTRWGAGLLASEELNYYRAVSELDGVLGSRGRSGQFDALGVLEVDVVTDTTGVTAVYLGTDGARRSFGIARRSAGVM